MRATGLAAIVFFAMPIAAQAADTNWLFLLDAKSVTTDGHSVTFAGVDAQTLAFSDHPKRLAHHMTTADFAGLWGKAAFGDDPPNAGVSATIDGHLVNAVIELTKPSLSGDKLSFEMKLVEGKVPEGGTDVVLFVDAFPTAVNNQITD